jgi:hypothetical protein
MGSEGEGSVKLRYNHYNQAFPIVDGLLKWAAVDDEYCISFVFQVCTHFHRTYFY